MEIHYKPIFLRDFKRLPVPVQSEAKERIAQFKNVANHKKLKIHKLKGRLKNFYSFSVTYAHRIVFSYEGKTDVVFLAIGDHDVYQ